MFDKLVEGDTVKIGEKEFKVTGHLHIKNRNSELGLQNGIYIKSVPYHCLEFLGAEIVKKEPPKFTPVVWTSTLGMRCFGLSSGNKDPDGSLLVFRGADLIKVNNWEVLEIEKC